MGAHLAKMSTRTSTRGSPPSATFILTASGHVYTVSDAAASLPQADLLILNLSPRPLPNPSYTLPLATATGPRARPAHPALPPRLRSLPISPYPAVVGTPIATLAYTNPARKDGEEPPPREWSMGRITEYRDARGHEAQASPLHRSLELLLTFLSVQTGTYDQLDLILTTTLPRQGSSGGPIVDVATGAVVGIVRGSMQSHGEKGARGFATPAERVFELFQLPGFQPKSKRMEQESAKQAREEAEGQKDGDGLS
jgi:hypothetical protein